MEAPGESTDFPGPQSTSLLDLDGPADDGAWQCRDRKDRVLLGGTVQALGGGMVLIGDLALGAELLGGGVLLEEALLLLVSRVRSRERTCWMGIAPEVELTPALREALERNGFVPPGPGSVFPTHENAPLLMGGRPPVLIAYVERPQPGFPPPRPRLSMWSEPGTSATPVPGLE
ncbi:hypothetical protein HMPREF3159_09295 [Brachybacterium sp. HMSC06H03]|uniref:hypothetical protein n=1 Tax=Brachybacterium sp. HMSC06H03 TaxID=1581127 RepID=UPI0008A340FA|nr:hypothetical protein [Brachybacterium sp. HMSC06H03]OFT56205.1 hypothetical protein HMPREF3159_09295 [Brachybacterium sp. HMSC06H03]